MRIRDVVLYAKDWGLMMLIAHVEYFFLSIIICFGFASPHEFKPFPGLDNRKSSTGLSKAKLFTGPDDPKASTDSDDPEASTGPDELQSSTGPDEPQALDDSGPWQIKTSGCKQSLKRSVVSWFWRLFLWNLFACFWRLLPTQRLFTAPHRCKASTLSTAFRWFSSTFCISHSLTSAAVFFVSKLRVTAHVHKSQLLGFCSVWKRHAGSKAPIPDGLRNTTTWLFIRNSTVPIRPLVVSTWRPANFKYGIVHSWCRERVSIFPTQAIAYFVLRHALQIFGWTLSDFTLHSDWLVRQLWFIGTCERLWFVQTCGRLWFVRTCGRLWFVRTCGRLWFVRTWGRLWFVRTWGRLWFVRTWGRLWFVRTCGRLWFVRTCGWFWFVHTWRWFGPIQTCGHVSSIELSVACPCLGVSRYQFYPSSNRQWWYIIFKLRFGLKLTTAFHRAVSKNT